MRNFLDKVLPWAFIGIFGAAVGGYIDLQLLKNAVADFEKRFTSMESKVTAVEAKTLSRSELIDVLKETRLDKHRDRTGG